MKTTVIAATIALGLTAGAALAGEPMVLTDAQLDRVTAGADEFEYLLVIGFHPSGEVSNTFTAAERAGENDGFLGGFNLDPDAGIYVKTVPPGGFVGVKP
jgi:hypothetical protein